MLFQLVDRLPEAQFRVIQMRFVEQKSIREIARELGRSEGDHEDGIADADLGVESIRLAGGVALQLLGAERGFQEVDPRRPKRAGKPRRNRALAAGATSVRAPDDIPYGARSAIVRDPEGYLWWPARWIG
ncbi:MAG TPA: sigma factor-like helix-turn-helix DNA-binding protein [Candidatus Sulfopaludibacter sp.]|nr:sigma factor-like helix-turn-helix DNA-binding protein [Candidatus Sulfopaludibacter sp.]